MLDGYGRVTDLSIYFSSENPITTKEATFGVRGSFGDSCNVISTQGVAQYVWTRNMNLPYGTLDDQTLDLQAYNILLTNLGIFIGNNFYRTGAWAGNVVIVTSSHTITE